MSRRQIEVTPDLILRAYSIGLFPMAESRDSTTLHWLDPQLRGHLPLGSFHLPRRLRRTLLSGPYSVKVNSEYAGAIAGCAAPAPGREDTWINDKIAELFTDLHQMGYAHSVETWLDGEMVGGLYGVALGGVFFGESMFSRARDASKVALVHLVAMLRLGGFRLLDTQWVTSHLMQFGAVEVPRTEYRRMLEAAIAVPASFPVDVPPDLVRAEFQKMGQCADISEP